MPEQLSEHFILLRGLTRESAHWGDFVPRLKAAFPHAKLTLLDLPGAGPYFREISPNTVNGILEKVRTQALEQSALGKPATLIAISLGGMVGWEWLLSYPEEIGRAVLINISLGGLSPFYHRLRWQCYSKLFAAAGNRNIEAREAGLLKLLSNREEHYQKTAADWIRIQKARPVSGKNAYRQLYAAATYYPGNSKPTPPILLLNSLGDKLVAPCCSETIAQKWQIELHTHSWGGHDLTLDDSEWVVTEIGGWGSTTPRPPDFGATE
ncbi:alpha/beta hydrolase [Methylomicrobium sp. Wu6]|uniref:alpha/beta fold hydrolase n=1 Tax=Methylomicrobium sp. Wu6 TaxID=3107928 RepID=UPI002DD663EB|nr:alpha/beta hydrolase [Methylomicrobium sp. Wu6]MEC4749071.1 alpha/beta hydrolase [Methylomicrobium sp. Wu6]